MLKKESVIPSPLPVWVLGYFGVSSRTAPWYRVSQVTVEQTPSELKTQTDRDTLAVRAVAEFSLQTEQKGESISFGEKAHMLLSESD